METPPRPRKLGEPPVSLEPEPREVHPLIFMDEDGLTSEMLDMSPKYSDPKDPLQGNLKLEPSPAESSEEDPREEDSTEIEVDPGEEEIKEEEVPQEIQEIVSPAKSREKEILKLVTNS